MKTIKAEFEHIKSQKMLLAAILAIMFIPFLYSVFFLKSVWNPYGDAKYLPVAVVNEDRSVNFRGKKLDVGDQLVKNLKKNDGLDWHFVSKKDAEYGLSHKEYYMVITIPKDFSKNATTVLDKDPKKMELQYTTNDSLNYIGKVISEEGAKQVNAQVKETVSTSYADTVFGVIKQVGKGFDTAAKGSKQLSDGSKTLSNGINTYTAGVSQVNDGVIKLQTGVVPLGQGVLKLADGSNTLANGINTYTAGVDQVNNGVSQLQNGTGALANGVGQLATGSNTLANGVGQYTAGASRLANGLQRLNNEGANTLDSQLNKLNTPQMQGVIAQLNSNKIDSLVGQMSSLQELPGAAGQLYAANTMINQAVVGMKKEVDAQAKTVVPLLQRINEINVKLKQAGIDLKNEPQTQAQLEAQIANLKEAQAMLATLKGQAATFKQLQELYPQLAQLSGLNLNSVQTAVKDYQTALTQSVNKVATNSEDSLKAVESIDSSKLSETEQQALQTIVNANKDNLQQAQNIQTASNNFQQGIQGTMVEVNKANGILESVKQLQASGKLDELAKLANSLDATKLDEMNAEITKALGMLESGKNILGDMSNLDPESLQKQILDLQKGLDSLATLTAGTADGAQKLNKKVNDTTLTNAELASYTAAIQSRNPDQVKSALTTSAARLSANGNANLPSVAQMQTFASQLKNINVMETLGKLQEFSNGVHDAYAGAQTLTSKKGQLTSGANQLAGGLGQLNAQVPTLTGGIDQLAFGTSQLAANSAALRSGASQLAGGLGQMNAQVPTLTSGVNQLANGTQQLNANSPKLAAGATQLEQGNSKLAKALAQGSEQVNDNTKNLSSKTSNMFASPTELKHKSYSYVPNYGYALAPYMLSVALYVGALVFNLVYPVRRLSDPDASATEWWLSKLSVGALVATGTSVVEVLLMMAAGLHPDHLGATLINAWFFALASTFIVMFLAVAFGNIGRFLGIIFLVIQLGSCGGSFPIQVTRAMGGFFQMVNPFLPMTYSVYGFRESLTSGLGANQVWISVGVQLIYIIASIALLWVAMNAERSKVTYVDVEDQNLND